MWSEIVVLAAGFFLIGLIFWIANLAEKRRQQHESYQGVALVSYLTLLFLYGLALTVGLLMRSVAAFLVTQPQLGAELGFGSAEELLGQFESFELFSLGFWLPALIGMALLLPPVRRLAARLIPIDPGSPVHALALSLTALVIANLLITLGVGLGNLAASLAEQNANERSAATFAALWAQQLFTALLAMIGVGWLSRRDWQTTRQRLGLLMPTLRQVGLAIGLALLLIPLVLLVEYVSEWLGVGENSDVEELSEQLLGPLFRSPFGIFTVGAAAAIGEETLLRGALQPRFGLMLTTIIFALLHSNYGISISTAIVFVLGLILGIVRIRANTTTAMIVHGVYNSVLGLLAYLGM
jgi:membrane protease YdiL (CAAX protease family)